MSHLYQADRVVFNKDHGPKTVFLYYYIACSKSLPNDQLSLEKATLFDWIMRNRFVRYQGLKFYIVIVRIITIDVVPDGFELSTQEYIGNSEKKLKLLSRDNQIFREIISSYAEAVPFVVVLQKTPVGE